MVSKCFTDLFSIDKSRGTPEEEFFQLCKSQVTGLVMHSFQNLLCLLPQGFRVISYERIVGLSTYNFTVKTIKQASGQDTYVGGSGNCVWVHRKIVLLSPSDSRPFWTDLVSRT